MQRALDLAARAASLGEVPVGALVVVRNTIIAEAFNRRELDHDPVGHAEVIALRKAAHRLRRWRLVSATLYVTLEPCPMCAGALVNARVDRLVYGASDPKAGAVESLYEITTDPRLNHQVKIQGGVLAKQASEQLRSFFRHRRSVK
ncbi:MAG: tRNA adenosine(34) deaminase TadA [Myxococcales bacterium]|nr:tRNA adenosine(34) deaminase TadA [Myxococcales bacterium]